MPFAHTDCDDTLVTWQMRANGFKEARKRRNTQARSQRRLYLGDQVNAYRVPMISSEPKRCGKSLTKK
jgi:hypothetical protein